MGGQVPIATIKKFVEKVSPFLYKEGSKDNYLNECIEQMYLECESRI